MQVSTTRTSAIIELRFPTENLQYLDLSKNKREKDILQKHNGAKSASVVTLKNLRMKDSIYLAIAGVAIVRIEKISWLNDGAVTVEFFNECGKMASEDYECQYTPKELAAQKALTAIPFVALKPVKQSSNEE